MCDCFHIAFPNWHAASSGAGAGRRLRGPEPGTEDNSICDEASQFTEGERPRPQGSSPVEEFPESDKYGDSECEAEHDPYQKSGKKPKKSGLGSIFDKRSTPKMSKLKEAPSPEAGVIVKTAKDGCAEGLVYSGGGKDGIFIKEVVPESPAFKNLHLKEGDQVLSATVYFDNIPYEDAIQILEHAQAYKVKLCLKRKPEITETEGAADSDAIPEDEVHPPEMRESGKKRRGDARISWPKFPTLGRGKKSRFTRSHSSSEADEQRKLELSPTTSDTESPIKSQDALKGKKKHKIKLPGLKRGRISSSEDTDAQNLQTEDMISPECLESPSREMQDMEEELKKDVKVETSDNETHKVELVCLDSTLKTADITAVLLEQETPSATASPDGKKKKKERSELKLRLLGRDKKHKGKSSPKRLKTLGASLDKENEKSDVVPSGETENVTTDTGVPKMSSSKSSQMELRLPKVEIDISDVGIICKPSHEKKGKGTEEKQSKTGFKLPKVGLGDVPTEEIIKIDAGVEESKTKEKHDAYDRLSKVTELPKREDIEIPGMEDVSKITKDFKGPRAPLAAISDAELQAETVQLSIDVDSVKEAVSKLPGYKLPKVDMSGVPIPEEFTLIDANAQRISVKTPTKGKQESKPAFMETSKAPVKLPNVMDVRGGELISETRAGVKKLELESKDITISTRAIISHTIEVEKVQKESIKFSSESGESPKGLDIKLKTPKVMLPDLSISKPDIKIPDFKMDLTKLSDKKDDKVQGERTIFLPEDKYEVKLPDVKTSSIKGGFEIPSKDMDATLKLQSEVQKGISVGEIETKSSEKQEKGGKFKMPNVGISVPRVKGGNVDVSGTVPVPEVEIDKPKIEMKSQEPEIDIDKTFGIKLKSAEIILPKEDIDISLPEAKVEVGGPKITESISDLEAQGGKFKLPKLGVKIPKMKGPELVVSISKKDIDYTLPDVKAEVDLKDVPEADVTLGEMKGSIPEQTIDVKAPSLEGDIEDKGGKFKMPKLGVKLPKVKGPEVDISLSKKDGEGTLPKSKVEVEVPEAPDLSSPEIKTVSTESEIEGQGGKFKMPKLGITMPKMKGPEIDFNLSKKDVEATLPEVKADIKGPDVKLKGPSAKVDVSTPEIDDVKLKTEMGVIDPATDAKAGKFKMPKFGISMPKVKGPEIDLNLQKTDKDVKPSDLKAEMKVPKVDITVGKVDILEANIEAAKPTVEIKPLEAKMDIKTPEVKSMDSDAEIEGQSGKFKIPRFTIAIPKAKGSEVDSSSQKKDLDVALPEAKIEVELPKVPKVDVEIKPPEIEADLDGQGGKFKMPKFGIKMPKVKGSEVDSSSQKKDLDVALPEAKIEVELPKVPKVDVEVKPPEIEADLDGQGGKFKMPKFGIKMPKVKGSEVDTSSQKIDMDVALPEAKIEVELPKVDVEVKPPEIEADFDGQGGKFKMPKLGIKMPKVKGPEFDSSSQKKDMEIALPEAKLEVELPKVDVEVKPPEIEADLDGQGGKFKMPKLGIKMPKVKGPEFDSSSQKKDMDVALPEAKLEVELPKAPKVDVEVNPPEIEADLDGQGGKFKMPKFGIKMPKVKGPEIDISLPKKDVKSPDRKADIKLPEVPNVDVSFGELDVKIPDAKIEVEKPDLPNIEVKPPSGKIKIKAPDIDVSVTEDSPSKFKMPSLGFSVPKKDVHVTIPEAKAEVTLPKVESKELSGRADVKEPDVGATTKGSPLKFKMPTFKLPKFGGSFEEKDSEFKIEGPDVTVTVPQANVDLPDIKAEVHLPETDVDVKAPSGEVVIEQPSDLEMDAKFKKPRFSLPRFSFSKQSVAAPEVDITAPEVNIPQTEGKVEVKGDLDIKAPKLDAAVDGQGSKFKLPKFGITMPKISAPDVDLSLSKKDVEVTLPEAKVDVEVKAPSIDAEITAPEIKVEMKKKEGSPSKIKMPSFKLPKFGASIPETEIKVGGAEVTVPQVDVDLPDVKAEVNLPEVDVKAPSVELEMEQPADLEMDAKFKKPRFSLPRFSFSKQSVPAAEVEINAPEVNIPQTEGKVELKGDLDIKSPELEATVDGQGGKFKLPKFGITMPKISAPDVDLSLSKKDAKATLPEAKVEGKLPDVEVKAPSIEAEIQVPEIKGETKTKEGSPSKLKMPSFKLPKFGASIPETEIKVGGAEVTVPEVDVDLPDVKAEVNLPEVDIKAPSGELEIEQPSGLEMDAKFKKPRFSLPRFSFSKQSVPAPEVEINAPEVNIPQTEGKVELKGDLDIKAPELEAQIDGQGGKFKLPKFGITMPKISGPELDLNLSKKDVEVTLPEAKVEGKLPEVEVKAPSIEAEIKAPEIKVETKTKEGSPSKLKMPTFKLPKFGASIPETEIKVGGAEVTVPEVDVDLPDVKAEVNLPEVDIKAPSGELEIEQPADLEMDAKFKKPRFSLPRFSFSKQSVPAPEVEINAPEVNIPQTEGKVELKGDLDITAPELEAQIDGQGSKFKLPKFGITMPKISAPDVDLSLSKKDVEVTLPEAKVDVEVKAPSIDAEITAPEIKVEMKKKEGSPSKIKMPSFKLPKFGASIPETEIKVGGAEVTVPEVDLDLPDVKAEVNLPEVDIKAPSGEVVIEQPSDLEMDAKFKKPRFSLPRFSFSKQSVAAPEVEINAPEVNIPQTEGKVELKGDLEIKSPELEATVDGQGGKFKLPKFGITMPKISGPELDLNLSKKDVEVTLPEAKVEGKLPDVEVKAPSIEAEIKAPEIKVETKTKEGSPSKLKMPSFKLPKFGASIPETEIKVGGAEVTVPEVDVDLPDVKAEVNLPEVDIKAPSGELEIEQPSGLEMDAKFKKPRFSLPRFSFSKQSVPAPEVEINAPDVNIPQTEGKVELKGDLEIKSPELEATVDGQGGKFKLPKFGITMPKISAPDVDLSLSKKDVKVTLPEAKVEGKLPDVEVKAPSIEAEIKVPEIKVETKTKEGSPSKLKMPSFKLPKFGASIPETEIKVGGAEVTVPQVDVALPDVKAEVNLPEVDVKAPSGELEIEQPADLEMDAKFKKPRFSLPRFSFSKQSVPAPEVEINAPEVNIPQTEGKVELKGDLDITAPELEAQIDGQGSKFKLPKFGITMPKISGPEVDLSLSKKDVKATLPEAKVEGKLPDVEVKAPSIEAEINAPEIKVETKTKEGSPSKIKMPSFKFPKFGASIPEAEIKVGGAEVTVPQVDVDLPEAEVNLPEVDIKAPSGEVVIDQPSGLEMDAKFKKPRFSLPRFSFSKQSVPAAELEINAPEVSIPQTEGKVEVKGEIDVKAPDLEATVDGQGSKFKLPKFGITMPKISAPDVDLSISKKDVEVTLPEAKVEGKLPSIEAEIKAPEIKVETKTKEGSPSKLKMPPFKFPKFGASIPETDIKIDGADVPQVNVDLPDVKAEVNLPEVEVKTPSGEVVIEQPSSLEMDPKFKKPRFSLPRFSFSKQSVPASEVDIDAPEVNIPEVTQNIEIKGEIDVKSPELDAHVDEQGSKFKFPKFGIAMPKISAPEMDLSLSKKNVEATLPESKVEGKLPDVEVRGPSVEAQIEAPEIKLESKQIDDSPSKFKMPSFKMPKFGVTTSSVSADGVDIKADIPEEVLTVKADSSSVDIKVSEPEGKRSKFKFPSLGFSTAGTDETQKDVGLPDIEIKTTPAKVDIKTAEMEDSNVEGSPSKFKMPTFKLPKFGATAEIDGETAEAGINISNKDVKEETSEVKEEVAEPKGGWSFRKMSFSKPSVAAPELDVKLSKVDDSVPESKKVQSPDKKSLASAVEEQPTSEIDVKLKKPRFSLPKISFGRQTSIETEEVDVPLPSTVEIKQTHGDQKLEAESGTEESKFKMPTFGLSMPKVKGPEIDLSLSKKDVNISSPEAKIESTLPEAEEGEAQKGASWSFPRFSFSKPSVNVTVESDDVKNDLKEESTPKQEVKTPLVDEEDSPAVEPEMKAKFSLPRFSFSKASAKETTIPENTVAVEVSLSEGQVKIKESKSTLDAKLSAVDTKDVIVEGKIPDVSKDIGGSPSKFKMPVFKMPKIGITTTVNEESTTTSKETEETQKITKEGNAVVNTAGSPLKDVKTEASIKGSSGEIKASTPDLETPQGETLGSPSKFKLPSFKMPRLSFSKPKPEDDYNLLDSKMESNQLESDLKEQSTSPKKSLPSFGEILKAIDVEFDVPSPLEETLGSPKKDHAAQIQQETLKETRQEVTKSPERTGWFKFPTFGLSSPIDAAKSPTKEDKIVSKSPENLTGNEELSPTCSIQSSEAFADISSTMTSENIGFSLSSPTKVTVKYSDPDSAALTEEMHSNVVMSTTKTSVISVEPNLPEMVTILSSGLSSSSEDTVKLESGKIHIVTSNIQVSPESQQARKLTSIHVQSEGASGQESWTVTDSRSSKASFMESRVVRESSSESKEVVITKQITRIVTTTEPISDETATSIKQLKDSVHTEKMRFFDGAEK